MVRKAYIKKIGYGDNRIMRYSIDRNKINFSVDEETYNLFYETKRRLNRRTGKKMNNAEALRKMLEIVKSVLDKEEPKVFSY